MKKITCLEFKKGSENFHSWEQQQQQATGVVDKLFIQLRAACPAIFHTLTLEDERAVKRQWVIGFAENSITFDMINAGMRVARRQKNPFMPSVGQFIDWCNTGLSEIFKLATATELVKKLDEYCAKHNSDNFCDFNYGVDANYWLITDLYQAMLDENLSRRELFTRAEKLISEMTKKMSQGYVPPTPKHALPCSAPSKPLTREQNLAKIREIKQKLKGGCHEQF